MPWIPGSDLEDAKHRHRKHKKDRRKQLRSPCSRPPVQGTGDVGTFYKTEGTRHSRTHLRMRWDEIAEDTSGFRITLKHYVVELEYSTNGEDWFLAERYNVSPKSDPDPDEKAHVIERKINAKYYYRMRHRGIASGKDGCKGAWSDWELLGNPGVDEPPSPINVKIHSRGVDRVVFRWKNTDDTPDPDIIHDKVAYAQWVLIKGSIVAPADTTPFDDVDVYLFDKYVHINHHSVRVRHDDQEDQDFYIWVRNVDSDGTKSAWIPGTYAGNSDPLAEPDPATVAKLNPDRVYKFKTTDVSTGHLSPEFTHRPGTAFATRAVIRGGVPTTGKAVITLKNFLGTDYVMNVHKHRRHSRRLKLNGHDGITYTKDDIFQVEITDPQDIAGPVLVFVQVTLDEDAD